MQITTVTVRSSRSSQTALVLFPSHQKKQQMIRLCRNTCKRRLTDHSLIGQFWWPVCHPASSEPHAAAGGNQKKIYSADWQPEHAALGSFIYFLWWSQGVHTEIFGCDCEFWRRLQKDKSSLLGRRQTRHFRRPRCGCLVQITVLSPAWMHQNK